jgi:hypothetical protein
LNQWDSIWIPCPWESAGSPSLLANRRFQIWSMVLVC